MTAAAPADPSKAEARLCSRLRLSPEDSARLLAAMRAGNAAKQAVVLSPRAGADYAPPVACEPRALRPWLPQRVHVPAAQEAPTKHPDYAAGLYYALDVSSCWESVALGQLPEPPQRSLDLCAAPGGKTMLLAAHYELTHHTANEVNAARRGILRQNVAQCGLPHTEVTGLRPDQWAAAVAAGECPPFDLLLVDAPCSGQSLLCKGIKNPGCLGPNMVQGNAKRQRGILLAAVQCVAPGGHLLYSTCTYDPEENEKAIAYILRRIPGWEAVEVPPLRPYGSALADFPAYRLYPWQGCGAGGFCCLLRRRD
ncbi:MAG: RsmB/NOP family class I SAM-dependent RNA methyltransferase [Akkermansiaceae bacterium]|nr:RsmB/NOP family class I SAM-dependent RNA methyltransferase [Akkermansiaceae bacterium]